MRTRWSVAGQLLALQLGIIAVVLVGVGGVSLAQAQIDFRRTEGARALSAAENLAARPVLRQALVVAVAARPHRPGRAHRRRRAEPLRRVVRGDRRRRRRGRRQHPRPGPARHAARPGRPVVGGRRRGPRRPRRSSRRCRCSARPARRPGRWWAWSRSGRPTRASARACCPRCPTCSPTWGWRASSGSRGRCSSRAGSSGRPSGWSRWRSAGSSSTARPCSRGSRRA